MAYWPILSQFSYIPDSQGAGQGMHSFPLESWLLAQAMRRVGGRVPQLRAQRPDDVMI